MVAGLTGGAGCISSGLGCVSGRQGKKSRNTEPSSCAPARLIPCVVWPLASRDHNCVGRVIQGHAGCSPEGDLCYPWLPFLEDYSVLLLNMGAHPVKNPAR